VCHIASLHERTTRLQARYQSLISKVSAVATVARRLAACSRFAWGRYLVCLGHLSKRPQLPPIKAQERPHKAFRAAAGTAASCCLGCCALRHAPGHTEAAPLAAVQRQASAYRKHLKRTAAAAAAVVKADLLPRSAVTLPLGKPSLRHAPAAQKSVNGNAGSGDTTDGDLGDVEALESPANGSPVLVSVKQASSQDPCVHNSR